MNKEKAYKGTKATNVGGSSPRINRKNQHNSWARLGLRVISSEAKVGLVRRIETALTKGAKVGTHFIVGFKSINKLLETMATAKRGIRPSATPMCVCICACRDSPLLIQNTIVDAAALQSIPTVIIPQFTEQMAAIFKLKRANCFALVTPSLTSIIEGESSPVEVTATVATITSEEMTASEMIQVTLDDLQEHLLQLATNKDTD